MISLTPIVIIGTLVALVIVAAVFVINIKSELK